MAKCRYATKSIDFLNPMLLCFTVHFHLQYSTWCVNIIKGKCKTIAVYNLCLYSMQHKR